MKIVRTKQFNYNLNVEPETTQVPQNNQQHVSVDFWASGFNYDIPEIIDPSSFHTNLKVYKNPKDASILIFDNNVLVPSGKEYLFENASQENPIYITLDVSSNTQYFDASIEYLSGNEGGYWIGPNLVNTFDNNTDIWRPADPEVGIPVAGTQMVWNNTEKYQDNVVFKDEDGTPVASFERLYETPDKVHIMLYPRDYTGTKVRRAKINFEAYYYFVDNFSLHDDPSAQKLYRMKASSFITISQSGIPVIINITADPDYNKNAIEYFSDENGELISMIGKTFDINSVYPSYNVGDIPYQYIGMVCITNSAIKTIEILDEGRNPVDKSIATIFGSDDNPFEGFIPTPSEITCKFYARIKKYQIPIGDTSDEELTKPIVYIIKVTLDDGNNTSYEITLNQYGYLADPAMQCYHIYDPNQPNLTDEEKEHTTIPGKLETAAVYPEEGLKFPVYISNT